MTLPSARKLNTQPLNCLVILSALLMTVLLSARAEAKDSLGILDKNSIKNINKDSHVLVEATLNNSDHGETPTPDNLQYLLSQDYSLLLNVVSDQSHRKTGLRFFINRFAIKNTEGKNTEEKVRTFLKSLTNELGHEPSWIKVRTIDIDKRKKSKETTVRISSDLLNIEGSKRINVSLGGLKVLMLDKESQLTEDFNIPKRQQPLSLSQLLRAHQSEERRLSQEENRRISDLRELNSHHETIKNATAVIESIASDSWIKDSQNLRQTDKHLASSKATHVLSQLKEASQALSHLEQKMKRGREVSAKSTSRRTWSKRRQ